MARINRRNTRRYAEHDVGTSDFYFAPAVLSLPRANRIGLIAHEIGHFILRDGPHSEADADQAAREVLGVRIRYDRRWPGKGLQTAGPRGPQGS